ncbi:hypothetical protein ACLKA6_005764 [Drosophila palustris]
MAFPSTSTVATIRPPSTTRGHLTAGSLEYWRRPDPDLGNATDRFSHSWNRNSSGCFFQAARTAYKIPPKHSDTLSRNALLVRTGDRHGVD